MRGEGKGVRCEDGESGRERVGEILREEEFEKKVRRSREGVRIGEMRGAKKNRGRRLQTWKVR